MEMSAKYKSMLTSKLSKRLYRFDGFNDDLLDHGMAAEQENQFTFEVAWEVCNKGNHL